MAKIGVIGAGTMGNGIAQVFAQTGRDVLLVDVDQGALDRALGTIDKNVRRVAKKQGGDEEAAAKAVKDKIRASTSLSDLGGCAIAIEAVSENFDVKKTVLGKADEVLPESAILATNTSSISITKLAATTKRPDRVIGMHFMNPVPVMTLVEVIRGQLTSDDTCRSVVEAVRALGKVPVEANDYPGFVANRILLPMINEAVFCLMEGVATAEAIDEVMKRGANHPIGPLALADLIGLDVCLAIMEVLHRDLGDSKYRPCPLLRRMVAAGLFGRKSGRGFYSY